MNQQLNAFDMPEPDFATVPITRADNPESSKVAAKRHQKFSQKSKCFAMLEVVKASPGETFTEYWNHYQSFLKGKKFLNEVDVSRQLYVLQKKDIIKRIEPGRQCRITGRLCCTWKAVQTK